MNQETKFSKKDLIVSLIIGEIAAWLILILAKGLLTEATLNKVFFGVGLTTFFKTLPVIFPIVCAVCLYIAYLISKKAHIIYQIAKFVLIGGFNTIFDWGLLTLAIFIFRNYLGIDSKDVLIVVFSLSIAYYSLYKSISFVLASINSYFWNKFWTFKRESAEKTGKEFVQFFIVTFIGFLINVGIASGIFKLVTPLAGLNNDQWGILAAVVATAISMCWNFIGYKFIVFEAKKPSQPASPMPQPPQSPPDVPRKFV